MCTALVVSGKSITIATDKNSSSPSHTCIVDMNSVHVYVVQRDFRERIVHYLCTLDFAYNEVQGK